MKAGRRIAVAGIAVLLSLSCRASLGAEPGALDGVWFGTFTNTLADGKVSHDMSALVLVQDGEKLTGSIGATIDRQSPIVDGIIRGDTLSFRIEGGGGIVFALRREAGHLKGAATGSRVHAVLDMTPTPGLMPHAQLVAEITAADARSFAAYETCDPGAYGAGLSPDLEFYQDNQPLKNRQEIIASLTRRCAEGIQYRRELDPSSLIINATPPYYAIEAGLQRIYAKQPDGGEKLEATVRFTLVWSKKSGTWQIVRAVSYDHR